VSLSVPFEGKMENDLSLFRSLPGSVARITEQHLKATDTDSEAGQVVYIMKEDPGAGRLLMAKADNLEQISVRGPIRSFTQADVSQGQPVLSACRSFPKSVCYNKVGAKCLASLWQEPVLSLFSMRAEL
jgi:hypothetical protein